MRREVLLNIVLFTAACVLVSGRILADETKVVDDHYDHRPLKEITPAQRARARGYSPYAGRNFPARALFGDTHHHTANSGDAFMGGDRLTPEEAYRFARGEEVVSSTGLPVKLSRPLDFLVISDHAEGLGVITEVYSGNPEFISDPALAHWNKMVQAGGADGKAREKIYEVAWGDAEHRPRGADGGIPPVGDMVDVANATWTDTIGDASLAAVLSDSDFDPSQLAVYHARAIEIPTPRWTAYDALRFGIEMSPDVPMKQQERAWVIADLVFAGAVIPF